MTEVKHRVPSGYASLDVAGATHGARAEKYAEFLWRSDPLAEAVMDGFARMPESEWRALLDLALTSRYAGAPRFLSALAQIRAGWSLPWWSATERVARRRVHHHNTGTERGVSASDDCILRLHHSPLRKVPRLHCAVPDDHRIPGRSRRCRFLQSLLQPRCAAGCGTGLHETSSQQVVTARLPQKKQPRSRMREDDELNPSGSGSPLLYAQSVGSLWLLHPFAGTPGELGPQPSAQTSLRFGHAPNEH